MRRVSFAFILGAACASSAFALPTAPYSFQTLNDPDAAPGQTYAYAINDAGQVAGWFVDPSGVEHAFIYSSGTWKTIDGNPLLPGGAGTQALGINDSGELVGTLFDGSLLQQGFYNGSSWSVLGQDPDADGNSTQYLAINNSGSLAGKYNSGTSQLSFLFDGSSYTTLDNPNDALLTLALGMNNAGDVTGYYNGLLGPFLGDHGFIFDGTTFTGFAAPGAEFFSYAADINDAGTVVGKYLGMLTVPPFTLLPPKWFLDEGTNFFDIDVPYDSSGVFLTGINDADEIVGRYTDSDGVHGFIGTPESVPEPATLTLLAMGLGLIVWRLRAQMTGSKTDRIKSRS